MAAYYTYLISSLPMLSFGQKPPFSEDEFLRRCQGLIPEGEIRILESILKDNKEAAQQSQLLKQWRQFDISLRNELVKVRAIRKKAEPHRYLREEHTPDTHLAVIATAAVRNPSILDAERTLDLTRWQAIEEFVKGHYFDLEVLVAYALELSLLLRWEKISGADKIAALEEVTKAA